MLEIQNEGIRAGVSGLHELTLAVRRHKQQRMWAHVSSLAPRSNNLDALSSRSMSRMAVASFAVGTPPSVGSDRLVNFASNSSPERKLLGSPLGTTIFLTKT